MPGFVLALIFAAVMSALSFFLTDTVVNVDDGITFPAPSQWFPVPLWSALAEFGVLWFTGSVASYVNRAYNLEKGTSALPGTIFIVAAASLPVLAVSLNAPMLMALATIISLSIMYACFGRPADYPQKLFLIASTLSFGSMVDYSFIPLTLALLMAAIVLREVTFRSVVAFILGLAAPYGIMIGFGLLDPAAIQLPDIWAPPETSLSPAYIVAGGATALTGLLLLLRRAIVPSGRSSRSILFNRALNVILLVMLAAAGADFYNFIAYLPTLMLLIGFLLAGLAGNDGRSQASGPVLFILTILFIAIYFFALT